MNELTALLDGVSLPLIICGLAALYACIRVIAEKDTMKKLPYLTVFNFAVTGIIIFVYSEPLGIVAACAYLIGSTLESNAVSSAYAKRNECQQPEVKTE